ncbi:hypothetical protein F4775DRAFT_578094 [Biscogniauxia sp. FL1348]|nr:hypothetical protein F4775DRAFT_578094 [Biscogniauxia sp. FL1348]
MLGAIFNAFLTILRKAIDIYQSIIRLFLCFSFASFTRAIFLCYKGGRSAGKGERGKAKDTTLTYFVYCPLFFFLFPLFVLLLSSSSFFLVMILSLLQALAN